MDTHTDAETEPLDAVILAGGINKIPLHAGYTPGYKALLPFGGKPAIQYTLEAVRAAPQVRRIFVVGPEAEVREALAATGCCVACQYVPGGDSPMESVINVLPHLKGSPRVLFATADLPLVTTDNVAAFLRACDEAKTTRPVNIYLSAVLRKAFTGALARSRKGHMVFRGGAVYHGNLALIDPRALEHPAIVALMKRIYQSRKNSLALVLAVGWRLALGYLVGALLLRAISMDQMARIASEQLGVGIIPVPVPHPEIAIDVDEPGDYDLVTREIEARAVRSCSPP